MMYVDTGKKPLGFKPEKRPTFGLPGINSMANPMQHAMSNPQSGDQDARRRKMLAMALAGGGLLSGLR